MHTEVRVARNAPGKHSRATAPDVMGVLAELSKVYRDLTIAAILNRLGYRTGTGKTWRAHSVKPEVDMATGLMTNPLPRCPHCGGLARPNVLMFDDADWLSHAASAASRRMDEWLATVERPVVIELGAGTHIPTIRRASERVAHQRRCPLIRINPRDSETAVLDGSGVPTYSVPLGALAGLQLVCPADSDN